MIKTLFAMNIIVIITALFFMVNGIKYFKNDESNKKGIECILLGSCISGICIVIVAILLVPTFFLI
ncbi:MAG TPA: hypothetical protein VIM70_21805 [Clostridium sp.]|uniref:hypothetical protein n=1 Tax=Clostridium sp. TaxID=1506 RepID=UPI002F94856E